MHLFSRVGYGIIVPFQEDYVRTYGALDYMRWLMEGFRITTQLEKRFGRVEGQMIISMAGLWTGCRWCSIAHMFISNLILYHEEQELGPIDELELPHWQEKTDTEVLELLDERLTGRWTDMAAVSRRIYALRTGEVEPQDEDDDLLMRTNVMWELLIECTIMAFDFDPESIPAWGYPARKRKLRARYRAARQAAHESGVH